MMSAYSCGKEQTYNTKSNEAKAKIQHARKTFIGKRLEFYAFWLG
jgi:hypothetical protein